MRISIDNQTTEWMKNHQFIELSLVQCGKCKKYHATWIEHKCEKTCGVCKWWDENDSSTVGCRCTEPTKNTMWRYNSTAYKYRYTNACKKFEER